LNKRFEHISPLVFGAACILLTLIISVFAFNNYRREKVLMFDSLVRQGETITRFIFSSTRSAVIRNMRMHRFDDENIVQDMQTSLDQALDHPGINYIHVVSSDGKIIASTVETRIGQKLNPEMLAFFNQLHDAEEGEHLERLVDNNDDKKKVFQYIQLRPFHPPSKELDPAPIGPDFHGRKGMRREFDLFRENLSSMMHDETVLLIELDASPYEQVVRRQLIQIGALSLVLLLVGIGGWLSINTLQRLKGSQSQLKSLETFRNLLVGSLPVGILAADEFNTLQVINPAAERLFGILATDVLNKKIDQILPADLITSITSKSSNGGKTHEFEYHFDSGQNETKIYYVYSLLILDEADAAKGRLLLVQDVSEMRELEKDLRKHERFAALGKVAAGVAHELRNPLSSIKGLAVLTGKKLENDERGMTSVNLMIKEVDRLDRSIRELLEFARPENLDLKKYVFDELVYEALEIFETDFSSRKIRVKTDIKDHFVVLADKDKMKQVFLNLFLNAIQAINENGDIAISMYEEQGMAVCSVEDSGGGIPADIIDKVFDPYFTTKNDGTGLGLAISVKIVEEHGGTLSVSSCENQGTTVYLRLPVLS